MCGSAGRYVKNSTVEHIGYFEVNSLKRDIMSVCMDEDCEIVYFSSTFYPLVFEREISFDIDFKSSSSRKYVCYCHKIEKNEIVNKVQNENARSVKDIIKPYGDVIISMCEKMHPLGCDCVKNIRKVIDETIKEISIY